MPAGGFWENEEEKRTFLCLIGCLLFAAWLMAFGLKQKRELVNEFRDERVHNEHIALARPLFLDSSSSAWPIGRIFHWHRRLITFAEGFIL
jgi:hypothetical protein